MRVSFTIKQKLFGYGFLGLMFCGVIAASGYWGSARLSSALHDVVVTSSALRNHMEADMMHDALRADVLSALKAGQEDAEKERQDIMSGLAEHAAVFRGNIAKNQGLPLNSEIKQAIEKILPALDAYIKGAEMIIPLALNDHVAATAQYPEFLQAFKVLEDAMGDVSDLIETSARQSQDAGEGQSVVARNVIVAVLVIAFLALSAVSLLIIRGILHPLRRAVEAAHTVAAGDLTADVDITHADDEAGQLLLALKDMSGELRTLIRRVADATTQLASAAEEMSTVTEETSQGIRQQQSETEQVATAMNEMSATVQDVARNAAAAAQAAHQ
ncbi:MAG: methyl-accepting chemotaxis protein, partial [Pseudomonadota bacterium]